MTEKKQFQRGDGAPLRRNSQGHDYTGNSEDERELLDDVPKPSFAHAVVTFGGKPRKGILTQENTHQMQLLVAGGTPIPTACTAVGCGQRWRSWSSLARDAERAGKEPGWGPGQSPELEWLYAMEQARAALETSMVARISLAAATDWKAAAWILERRAAQRWAPKAKMTLQVDQKNTLEISTLSTSKLLAIAKGILPDHSEIKVLPSGDGTDASDRNIVDAELEGE